MKVDGKAIASEIFTDLHRRVDKLKATGITPQLVVILVGENPASVSYVQRKEKKAAKIGALTTVIRLKSSVTTDTLLKHIAQLNKDTTVHGIIVQRPLPPHIDNEAINQAVDPHKDIDAFNASTPFQMPLAEAVLEILRHIQVHEGKPIFIS